MKVGITRMEKTPPAFTSAPSMSKVAQYVRMSTEHQQYSPENQSDIIHRYAAKHNMEVVQTYSDHGRSGLNIAGRDGLSQLVDDVEKGQVNVSALLVYDVMGCTWLQQGRWMRGGVDLLQGPESDVGIDLVVLMSSWPRICWMNRMSAPFSCMCVAIVWRSK